jgi:fido (protein-threonine AMPylation protein)
LVARFLFKDRDGRTELPEEFKRDLIPEDIKTGGDLDVHEENNIVDGLIWLDDCDGDQTDSLFWMELHRRLFGKVWKWAGKVRKHDLLNPDFNNPAYINQNIKQLEGDLKFWLTKANFKDRREVAALFHERFLTIHPFPNGNGRTVRILIEYICKRENIIVPTWGSKLRDNPQKHRATYIEAVMRARHDKQTHALLEFMYS